MKVWKLSPKSENAGSGYVRIRAATEQRAREIAEKAFEKSKVKTMHSVNWAELDWANHNAVECVFEADDTVSMIEGILDVQ